MFRLSTTFTVRRPFKYNGTVYDPGQTFTADQMAYMRHSDSLMSRKFIVPTPDPHGRKGDPLTPTPISLPASIRQKMTARVEPHLLEAGTQDLIDVHPDAGQPEPEPEPEAKKTTATKRTAKKAE